MKTENIAWPEVWNLRAKLYAFFANSLLRIMTTDSSAGLREDFWAAFPLSAANAEMSGGLSALARHARERENLDEEKKLEDVQVEFTRLFVGPGAPAAAPWESLNQGEATALFGQATLEMKKLYTAHGIRVENPNRQLEDHLGLELMFLARTGENFAAQPPSVEEIRETGEFLDKHPLSWICRLRQKAKDAAPGGYYPALLELVHGYLLWDRLLLTEAEEKFSPAEGGRSQVRPERP
jgi:TorA maturation chaperone TorD